jgi:uracil-DNA glycosylase
MSLDAVLSEIRACRACAGELPHDPRPVVRVFPETRLLICGQAPGRRVHESGLPFTDPSGDRLRDWLGVDYETFYGDPRIGVAAMAFCFPGTDPKGGDYPPPPRCASLWRPRLIERLPKVELTLLVGSYAMRWKLGKSARASMTETVRAWRDYLPHCLPMPHPSWRNTAWLKRNPWFEDEVVPYLRQRVGEIMT